MDRLSTDEVVFELPFRPPTFERETVGKEAYTEVLAQARDHMIDGSENLHDLELDTLASDPDTVIATYNSAMRLRGPAWSTTTSTSRASRSVTARLPASPSTTTRSAVPRLGGVLTASDDSELLPEGLRA